MQKRFFILSALMAACACSADNADEVEPRLVVEAWIESDGAPVVMVTTSVTPTREPQAISSLSNHVERWAKVSVSDGESEIILTGYITSRYFPPYYYTTGRMTGEVGKTYRLTVETKGRRATAYATIPPPQDLIRLEPVPFGDDGDQFLIKATVSGTVAVKDDVATCTVTGRSIDRFFGSDVESFTLVLIDSNELRYRGDQQGMVGDRDIFSRN